MSNQWIVVVGTEKDSAKGRYREFAGENFWGPMTGPEAHTFMNAVKKAWEGVPEDAFVYGKPYVRAEPLRVPAEQIRSANLSPAEIAADNWHL